MVDVARCSWRSNYNSSLNLHSQCECCLNTEKFRLRDKFILGILLPLSSHHRSLKTKVHISAVPFTSHKTLHWVWRVKIKVQK